MHNPTIDPEGKVIVDKLRGHTSDHPEQNDEAGTSRGGTWPCAGCTAKANMFDDLSYCFRSACRTLEGNRKIVSTKLGDCPFK